MWVYPLGVGSLLLLGLAVSWWVPLLIVAGSGVIGFLALVYATVEVRHRTRNGPSNPLPI
jgi:hypothetical protein